jgi:hypothetical protein
MTNFYLPDETETKFATGTYLIACALVSLIHLFQIKSKDKNLTSEISLW